MSFLLYLTIIALTYIRVLEAFAPEMAAYHPMLLFSVVALVAALIRVAITKQIAAGPIHFVIVIGLILSIALSVGTNGWLGGAASAMLDFAPTAALFVLTLLNVTSVAKLRAACAVIVISMLVAAAGSVAGYHFGFMGHRLLLIQNAGQDEASGVENEITPEEQESINLEDGTEPPLVRIRNFGMLSDPNDFAQAIVMVLPLLYLAWGSSRVRNLLLVILPASFLLYALYLTHSRGGLVGLVAVLLLSFRKSLGSVRTLAVVAALIVGGVVTDFAGGRAYSIFEASAGERMEVWSSGLEMFKAHPWFGVGYGQFVENSAEYGLTAHNSFVLCLAELGIAGCFFWVGLIVLTIRELSAAENAPLFEESEEMRRLVIALRASLIGFLACALLLSRAYTPHLFLILGLCIGASHCAFTSEETPPAVGWIPQSAVATVAGIFVVYIAVLFKHNFGAV